MTTDNRPSIYDFRGMLKAGPRLSEDALDAVCPMLLMLDFPLSTPHLATLVIGDFATAYAIYALSTFTAKNLIDLSVLNMVGFDYGPLIEHYSNAHWQIPGHPSTDDELQPVAQLGIEQER